MNYTLHQLKIYIKVSEIQSITKASEELHLTQPAVSIQLKKFQEQFDIPLMEVIGKKIYITDFGREVAQLSRRILDNVDEIRNTSLAYKGFLAGKLTISVVSTGKYVMPYFLTDFLKQNPGIDLIMDVTNKTRVVESLEKNEVDFALVSVLPEHLKVDRVELMQNKLYLVRKFEGLKNQKNMPVKNLASKPMIFREKGSATRRAMEMFIRDNKISLKKSLELTSNEAVKQAVIAGLGYSVMPVIGIKNALDRKDLEIIPVKTLPITTHWNLIWLKEKNLSPLAAAYIQFLKAFKNDIIEREFQWYDEFEANKQNIN